MKESKEWNKRFMDMAYLVASWSKDPSSKVGAVIVDDARRIVATGFNGFARGVNDTEDRLGDRELKYRMVLHAEENAIMFARRDLSGCSLYVTTMPPCSHCAALVIQSGIKKVYACRREVPERWKRSYDITKMMFQEAGVRLSFLDYDGVRSDVFAMRAV